MDKTYFNKKFSVGLALDSAPDEYEELFSEYGNYIDNLYFSPPFGDRFHGRTKIADQFHREDMKERFWDILAVAQQFNISLEVVFNTHLLHKGDLVYSAEQFGQHNCHLSKVCIQDAYYSEARKVFPDTDLVHSVNCMPDDRGYILQTAGKYEEYVVGRQYIRDRELFSEIRRLGTRCVLLLNNGCSHWCGGCGKMQHCKNSYLKSRKKYSIQELYAIQSIMPYEIWENMIDTEDVDLFKLSTRNADVYYIKKCLESYINNTALELIQSSSEYYLLWSRILWLVKEFPHLDYEEIKKIKQTL